MNGFGESLSSLDKASDFGGSCLASPMLPHGMGGSAGAGGGDGDQLYSLYGGSDQDQRYPSNTISSTSSTRSGNGAQAAGGSSKFGGGGKQQTGNLLSVGGGKGGSKSSKSKTSKQQQQELSKGGHHPVSSLDMQRINRYGTIPKGAQINAYLDSLRQDEEAAAAAAALDLHNEAHLFAVDAALNQQQHRFHDDMAVGHGLGMPMVPPLPSPSLFSGGQGTSTFAKEQQRNVAILEDISNQHHHHPPHHAKTKSSDDSLTGNHHQQFNLQQQQFQNQQQPSSSHHFNFTRQKSDLTHSKTSENVSGGNQSSKSGRTSQLRGQKTANHLHLLKAVASPRLQGSKAGGGGGGGGLLESSNHQFSLDQQTYPPPPPLHSSSGAVPAHFAGFRNDIVDPFSAGQQQQQQQQPQFPMPPAQFCNQVDANFEGYHHHHQKALAKSDSFDFVSGLNATQQQQQSVELIPLDALISSEDFPPPPPANQLCPEEEEEEAANLDLDQQQQQLQPINNSATKVDGTKESKKPKKPPKEEKKSKKEAKAEAKAKAAAATSTVSTSTSSTANAEGAGKSSSQQQQQPNSAFMSELYESFRQKAAAKATADTSKGDATSDGKSSSANLSSSTKTATTAKETTAKAAVKNSSATTSASSRASFLFKSRSTSIKPEPNCPAPAVPTLAVNLSQSKFYTKDFVDAKSGAGDSCGKGIDSSAANGDAAANAGGGASVEAEYVTPVQKRTQHPQLLRSQLETAKTNDQQVGSSEAVDAAETVATTATTTTTTPAATSKPKKPSKIAMLFNGGGSKSSKESKAAAKAADLKSSKTAEAAAAQAEEDPNHLLSKSTISNSGYDADDECKRSGQQQPPLNSYKKFWESQSSGSAAAAEADSGLGSCASSNAATSKSNDSVISVGSFGSASSAKQQQAMATVQASPKLGARGLNSSSKIPVGTSTLFSKKTPSPNSKSISAAADGNSGSVDNIPQKCAKEEASASQESKPTLVFITFSIL